jgi:hypothetical protein
MIAVTSGEKLRQEGLARLLPRCHSRMSAIFAATFFASQHSRSCGDGHSQLELSAKAA